MTTTQDDIKIDQVWERKDPRDGGVRVTVIFLDSTFVQVHGKRRSTIRRERFIKDYKLVQDVR